MSCFSRGIIIYWSAKHWKILCLCLRFKALNRTTNLERIEKQSKHAHIAACKLGEPSAFVKEVHDYLSKAFTGDLV